MLIKTCEGIRKAAEKKDSKNRGSEEEAAVKYQDNPEQIS
jgi:hypothetical protein